MQPRCKTDLVKMAEGSLPAGVDISQLPDLQQDSSPKQCTAPRQASIGALAILAIWFCSCKMGEGSRASKPTEGSGEEAIAL